MISAALSDYVTIGGGVSLLVAARYVWKGAAIASVLKSLAIVLVLLGITSVIGILDVAINPDRAMALIDWGREVVGA